MIQKCIHDNFEIDLSSYEITIVEENQWFNDRFFTKYTLPFEVALSQELNQYFHNIIDYNAESPTTYFEMFIFIEDSHYSAVLEVKELLDRNALIEISYGFDEFPNFNKKLSELPLQVTTLAQSLFDHAPSIINKSWPAVNYNFVQVHTDSFDAQEERWSGFEGIINNYKDGAFLINEFDANDNVTYNRNIMIPMPYFLHVLTQGFADAGYQIKGDVINDPEFLKMCFFKETEEYINARIEGEEYTANINSFDLLVSVKYKYGIFNLNSATRQLGFYQDSYVFPKIGRYKISGVVYLRRQFSDAKAEIFYKGQRVASFYQDYIRQDGVSERVRYVDFNVDVDDLAEVLTLENRQITFAVVNEQTVNDAPLWDLTITPIAIYENGKLVPPVITSSKLDLTKCVPDITFGDFVKALKNWKNLELKISGSDVYMNYIEPKLEVEGAIDLSQYNARSPRRKFKQGDSYWLKFKEVTNDVYSPGEVFVNINGVEYNGDNVNDKTNEIKIDAVPLPVLIRDNIKTALAVNDGSDTICAVLYEGVNGILNLAEEPSEMTLPRIYDKHFTSWIDFRIKSQSFTTNFNALAFKMKDVKLDSKLLMYNNHHLIKVLTKTTIPGTEVLNYELELELLK